MADTSHYEPHFTDNGHCQCDCEECHSRLTNGCWCPDCTCDSPEECAAAVGYGYDGTTNVTASN